MELKNHTSMRKPQDQDIFDSPEDFAVGSLDMVAVMQGQRGMKTVCVGFHSAPASGKEGRFKMLTFKKPVDMELVPGDIVLVPVGNSFFQGTVAKVHEYAQIQPGIMYRWVVAKLDVESYTEIEQKEDRMRQALHAAEARKRAEEAFKAALLAAGVENIEAFGEIPMLESK